MMRPRTSDRRGAAPLLLAGAVVLAGCAGPPPAAYETRPAAVPGEGPSGLEPITAVPVDERRWRFAGREGRILATPHYRIHTTLTRHSILERLPLFLERALAHYTTALAPLPAPRSALETYLFQTRNEWEAKTRQMLPEQATTFLTLGRGGYTTRGTSVLYYIGRSDTLAIAAHEGWHQYSQQTLRNQLPLWLEEGVATYMEGYTSHPDGLPKFRPWSNLERYHTLRDAARVGRLIPLSELLERTPQSFLEVGKSRLLIYYAQVWALTHFLVEGEGGRYRQGLEDVLLDAVRGRLTVRSLGGGRQRPGAVLGPAVVAAYFDHDLDAFEERYLEFVDEIVRTGGRDRVVQGRSPLE